MLERNALNSKPLQESMYDLVACWRNSPYRATKISSYFPAYAKLFGHLRGTACTFIETGILDGGSLFMWRDWLGDKARIIGLDMNPEAVKWRDAGFEIFIGDQGDPAFWHSTLAQIGHFDALLDDGGHQSFQQIVTLREALRDRAGPSVIVIEDTATSFMRDFASHGQHTFLEYSKDATDCLIGRSFQMYENRFPEEYNREAVDIFKNVLNIEFFNGMVAFHVDHAICFRPEVIANNEPSGAKDFRYEGVNKAEVEWPDILKRQIVTVLGADA